MTPLSPSLATWLARQGILAGLPVEAVADLLVGATPRALVAGEALYRRGEAADEAFFVVDGRLERRAGDEGRVVEQVTPGALVGEAALLGDDARSYTVRARWPSMVVPVAPDRWARLVDAHPAVAVRLAAALAGRLVRAHAGRSGAAVEVIAVHPLGSGVDAAAFVDALADGLGRYGRVVALTGAAGEALRAGDRAALGRWLDRAAVDARWILLEGAADDPRWTAAIVAAADRVLTLARSEADPAAHPVGHGAVRRELVLLGRGPKRNGAAWQRAVDPAMLHRVDPGRAADTARVARFVAGEAVALVLSGGLFRGAAHVGVLRALEEAGIPVDFACGTSIGALTAGAVAMGLDAAAIEQRARETTRGRIYDLRLPVRSVMGGRHIERIIRAFVGDRDIADLDLPYFATSNSLARAEVVVHRTGPVFDAVRASSGFAPIMPPVRRGAELLVDGAFLSNLPVDQVRAFADCRRVVVNLMSTRAAGAGAAPTSIDLFKRVWSLPAAQRARRIAAEVALYIEPDVAGLSAATTRHADLLFDRGYRAARDALAANPTLRRPGEGARRVDDTGDTR